MNCDVGKVTEGLENEWRRSSDGKVGEWAELIDIEIYRYTAELILQPFRHFIYVIAHSPTLPSLYVRHSSFCNPFVASLMSQLILQLFRCFTYLSIHSPTLLSLLLRHLLFTYVTWRAAHASQVIGRNEWWFMMIMTAKWYSGTLWAWSFPTFVLQVRKNPEKTLSRKPVPTGDRTRARWMTSAHATTCSTAVDKAYFKIVIIK